MWLLLWQFVGMQRKGSHRSSAPIPPQVSSLNSIKQHSKASLKVSKFLLCMRSQPVSPESYIQECLKLIKAPQDVEGSTPPWGNGIGHRWLLQGPQLALGLSPFFESTQRKVIFWRCGRSCPNQRSEAWCFTNNWIPLKCSVSFLSGVSNWLSTVPKLTP